MVGTGLSSGTATPSRPRCSMKRILVALVAFGAVALVSKGAQAQTQQFQAHVNASATLNSTLYFVSKVDLSCGTLTSENTRCDDNPNNDYVEGNIQFQAGSSESWSLTITDDFTG